MELASNTGTSETLSQASKIFGNYSASTITFVSLEPDFYVDYETAIIKFVKFTDITTNSNFACKEDAVLVKVALSHYSLRSINSYTRFGIPGSSVDLKSPLDISDVSKKLACTLFAEVKIFFNIAFHNILMSSDYKMENSSSAAEFRSSRQIKDVKTRSL